MKKIPLFIVLSYSLFLITSCGTGKIYTDSINSWIGAPLDELIARWGQPGAREPTQNGQTKHTWITTAPNWIRPQECTPPDRLTYGPGFEEFERHSKDVYTHLNAYHENKCDTDGPYGIRTCVTDVFVDQDNKVTAIEPRSFMGISDCRHVPPPPAR